MSKLPKGWELVQFDKVCDIRDGTHDSPKYIESGIPFITSKHLTDNGIDFTETNYISKENHIEFSKRSKVDNGDILFGMIGTIGKPIIVNTDFEFSIKNIALLKLSCNELLSNIYVLNLLKSNIITKQFSKLSNGGVQSFIALGMIRKLKIPLPPLEEQKKIADILSIVDKKIAFVEENINATEELKKGLMQKLLTEGIGHTDFKDSELGRIPESWEVVQQSDVATFYNGRAYKLSEWEESGTPVIRLQNLTGTGTDYYYSTLQLPEHQYCENGDLLYMWSATFGPVWWKGERAIYHYHIWKITTEENKLDRIFLFYLLDQITIRMKKQSHGSTMIHVTKGGMEKLKIQLPPLEEQKQIAEILSTVDNKLENLKEKKLFFEELKKGLMQKLLTGEVRV
ncbi:restriction endonuclease subunit S [Aliarcobacter cryaerophilus]|uniref:restriction endonuclease subunit S n=1 Tax=Aliarcobacter cryaerophilus TaxID=28198 RepID=UPI003DA395E2